MSAIEQGLKYKQAIKDFVDPAVASTLGQFVAADPANIPRILRPYQAGWQRACDIFAATGAIGDAVGGAGILFDPACRDYLGDDMPEYSEPQPPFTGGQCAGVAYDITISFNSPGTNGNPRQTSTVRRIAPITFIGEVGGTFFTGGRAWSTLVSNPFGPGQVSSGFYPSGSSPSPSVVSIVRVDGLPDDCGDPPVEGETGYNPIRPGPPPPPDFNYEDSDGPSVPVVVGPVVEINGEFGLTVNIGGIDVQIGAGTPGSPSEDPGTGPDFGNEGEGSEPQEPGTEDEQDTPTRCVRVLMVEEPPNRSIEVAPQLARSLATPPDEGWGFLQFKVAGSYTEPIRLESANGIYCYCCTEEPADGYYVKYNYGYRGIASVIPPKSEE